MPEHIKLISLQYQVLNRYPTPLRLLPVFKLLTQVLLERKGEVEMVISVNIPLQFAFQRYMLRLLEGRLNAI